MNAAFSVAGLASQLGRAGKGVLRLARLDPRWAEAFDFTTAGFLSSFLARFCGLPFYLVFAANLDRALANAQAGKSSSLWMEAFAFVLDGVGFPILIALLARPLGVSRGYAAFIVITNWASLFLNLVLAATSVLAQGGEVGLGAFGFIWFVLAGSAVYLTWRAARETLTHELAPVVLVLVLSLASGALTDQLVAWLAGAG